MIAYNGAAISYDAIGNPTSDGTWTYTWAKGRQLQSMSKSGTSVSYTYNEDGLRVQKNVSGTVTSYILHGKNVVELNQGGNVLHFFYGADGSPAMVVYNGAGYGYVKNLQGDIVSIVNSSGTEVVHYTYDAWGKLLSKTGTLATSLGTLNPFRYRGYVYDEETGLYYLRSRYYNPTWGRFVNADNRIGKVSQILSFNQYTYCKNNATGRSDPNGTSSRFSYACLSGVADMPSKKQNNVSSSFSIERSVYKYMETHPEAPHEIFHLNAAPPQASAQQMEVINKRLDLIAGRRKNFRVNDAWQNRDDPNVVCLNAEYTLYGTTRLFVMELTFDYVPKKTFLGHLQDLVSLGPVVQAAMQLMPPPYAQYSDVPAALDQISTLMGAPGYSQFFVSEYYEYDIVGYDLIME